MAWYRTGSITVTNGSVTVSGAGTAWISNAAIGEALYAPDGRLYEIVNIASDTTITLQSAYLGATASAQAYVIVPSQSYIRDLAAQAADLVNNYSTIYNTVGQGKFGDGTLAAPGIRFSDDLDTGFFRSASNEVTFVAGGTAIFKYSLTGGLQFTGVGNFGNLAYTGTLTGGTGVINIGSGQVYKDASGNVGIGTSSPSARLHVSGATAQTSRMIFSDTASSKQLDVGADATGGFSAVTGTNSYLIYTNTQERLRVTGAGNVGIGTNSPTVNLDVVGTIKASTSFTTPGAIYSDDGTTVSRVISSGGVSYLGTTSNHPVVYQTNNIERVRISSAGDVGIGTSGPTSKLTVVGGRTDLTANNEPYALGVRYALGTGIYYIGATNSATPDLVFSQVGGSEKMRLTNDGNLGLGVTPSAWGSGKGFEIGAVGNGLWAGAGYVSLMQNTAFTSGAYRYVATATAARQEIEGNVFKWFTAPSGTSGNAITFTERMRIGADGFTNVFVTSNDGITSRNSVAAGTSNAFFVGRHSATGVTDGTISFIVWSNGNVVNTNNSYGAISDVKLKENITPATPKLDKLMQVEVVNYNLKDSPDQKLLGVVAQQLEQVFPSLVEESPDRDEEGNDLGTTTKSVKYSVFVPMLIKAMQEQQAMITELKAELDAYKAAHP